MVEALCSEKSEANEGLVANGEGWDGDEGASGSVGREEYGPTTSLSLPFW